MKKNLEGNGKILLVDDEPQILSMASTVLGSEGFENLLCLHDSRDVLPLLHEKKESIALTVLDLIMPHVSGRQLLSRITSQFPGMPVIVMTGAQDIETAIACMKAGAIDYLVKPVETDRLVSSVRNALEIHSLQSELISLKEYLLTDVLKHEDAFSSIITRSRKMRAIFQYLEAIAPTPHTVIITGETGVGKELIAKALHRLSGREGDYVAVNVAGLDDTMFSDTLFGHRKGAFTGAEQARSGLIAKAEKGTLFLDEIGDLRPSSQVKLLRLLQEGTYYALGSDSPAKSSARIVAASNRDIKALVNDGVFRKDLFYRLCSHRVHVPPLRERPEDVPALLDHFIEAAARLFSKGKPAPNPEIAELLSGYDFPGNVRELEAMAFDALALHKSGRLSADTFREITGRELSQVSPKVRSGTAVEESNQLQHTFGHFPTFAEIQHYLVEEAMRLSKGNQSKAASMLGVTRQALNKRIKKKE